MEKLFNWTIGSFFRTIGRLIAYFAIGAFIAYILGHSNIDLGGITNLFYTKVSAATFSVPIKKYQSSYFGVSNNTGLTEVAYGYVYNLTRSSNSSTINNRFFQFSTPINGSNFDYIQFDFLLGLPQYSELNNDSTLSGRYCKNYTCSSTAYDCTGSTCATYCEEWGCTQATQYTEGTINNNEIYPVELNELNFSVRMEYTDGNFAFCDIQNGKIICPTNRSSSIKGIDLYYNFHSDHIANATFILYRATEYYQIIDTQSAIENQTQQQEQQHNETMTIVTDTNTTQEQNETTTFFEGFQFSSDSTGLVGVITAPLRVFTAISEGTFSDLCFTLKGKQTCFPNGNMIWQKTERTSSFFGSGSIATGIQAFVTLFNLVAGGYLLYKMGASVKRLTEELIDPRNTRIEVMKL